MRARRHLALFCEREIARRDQRRIDMSCGLVRFFAKRAAAGLCKSSLWRFRQRLPDQCNLGQFLLTPRAQFRMSLDRRARPYRQTPQPAITTPSLA